MITKATYAGSSNTMCEIEPSMDIVPVDDPRVVEWVDAGNTIFPYAPPAQTADEARAAKQAEIEAAFDTASNAPVLSNSFTWHGGEACAHRMYGKAKTMEQLGETIGVFGDINSVEVSVTYAELMQNAAAISVAYETAFKNRRTKLNAIIACGDDVACINAVVW